MQNAFIEGRQFLDVVLMANEVVYLGRKQGVSGVLCKLDFKKACDHANWKVLEIIKLQMEFEETRWK